MNKILIILLLTQLAQNSYADDTSGNLTIQVRGLFHERGQVVANLFREGDDVMKIDTVYLQSHDKISEKQAQLVFHNLQYGKYALTVFHDENSNGKLDHNLLRMPAEPLGFSNGFQLGLFSGLPSFEKLQFIFGPSTDTIVITLNNNEVEIRK